MLNINKKFTGLKVLVISFVMCRKFVRIYASTVRHYVTSKMLKKIITCTQKLLY